MKLKVAVFQQRQKWGKLQVIVTDVINAERVISLRSYLFLVYLATLLF